MENGNKKPDGFEEQTQIKVQKKYIKTLATGSTVQIYIIANLNEYESECFNNFYYELGRQLNNMD